VLTSIVHASRGCCALTLTHPNPIPRPTHTPTHTPIPTINPITLTLTLTNPNPNPNPSNSFKVRESYRLNRMSQTYAYAVRAMDTYCDFEEGKGRQNTFWGGFHRPTDTSFAFVVV
jgi:hypothetical protein